MEIMVVAIIALIVFGPQKLPEIARTVGRAINELKRQAADIRGEFEAGLDERRRTGAAEEPVTKDEAAAPDEPASRSRRTPETARALMAHGERRSRTPAETPSA